MRLINNWIKYRVLYSSAFSHNTRQLQRYSRPINLNILRIEVNGSYYARNFQFSLNGFGNSLLNWTFNYNPPVAKATWCLCVFVFIFFHRKGFFRLQWCLGHAWEVPISNLVLWVLYQVLLPNSFISISKNVIIHLQKRNSSSWQTGEKMIRYIAPAKDDIYWYRI